MCRNTNLFPITIMVEIHLFGYNTFVSNNERYIISMFYNVYFIKVISKTYQIFIFKLNINKQF